MESTSTSNTQIPNNKLANDYDGIMPIKAKRDIYVQEIRKSKVDKMLNSKRFRSSAPDENKENDLTSKESLTKQEKTQLLQSLVKEFLNLVNTKNFEEIEGAIRNIRKVVSEENDSPLRELYQTGILSHLLKFLDQSYTNYETLQYEVLWVLTNLTSGDNALTALVYSKGLLEAILPFLNHHRDELVSQALWCLGNLSGDSDPHRESMMDNGLIEALDTMIKSRAGFSDLSLSNFAWCVANLSMCKKHFTYDKYKRLLPAMEKMLSFSNPDVISNCLWFFANITNCSEEIFDIILNKNLVKLLVKYLEAKDFLNLLTPALRAVGNILSSSKNEHVKLVVDCDVIPKFAALMENRKVNCRRETCWSLSNLIATDANLLAQVMDSTIIHRLFYLIKTDVSEVRQECILCVTNALTAGNNDQVEALVEWGLFYIFPPALTDKSTRCVIAGLDCLSQLLKRGEQIKELRDDEMNPFLLQLENVGLMKVIEVLQGHEAFEVYSRVSVLIDDFFAIAS